VVDGVGVCETTQIDSGEGASLPQVEQVERSVKHTLTTIKSTKSTTFQ